MAIFHIGAVAQLAQPLVVGIAPLGLAQLVAGGVAQAFGRFGVGAPAQHLYEVHAELGANRLADLAVVQALQGLFEFGHRLARIQPAQITPFAGRAVAGKVFCQGGEVGLAGLHVTLEERQPPFGLGLAFGGRNRQQDVAGVDEFHGAGSRIGAFVLQLQDVKAGRAADRVGHVARFHGPQGVGKQAGQLFGLAPADLATAGRITGIGAVLGQSGEVLALACPGHEVGGALLLAFDGLCVDIFGQLDENLAHVVFGLGHLATLGQLGIDLSFGDGDVAGGFTLAQAGRHDFRHQLAAEGIEGDTLASQPLSELLGGQAVVLGHVGHGTVHFGGRGLEAVVVGILLLGQLQDHLLQHLPAQLVGGRGGRARGGGHASFDEVHLGLQFAFGDHPLVDHGHDAIQRLGAIGRPAGIRIVRGAAAGRTATEQAGRAIARRRGQAAAISAAAGRRGRRPGLASGTRYAQPLGVGHQRQAHQGRQQGSGKDGQCRLAGGSFSHGVSTHGVASRAVRAGVIHIRNSAPPVRGCCRAGCSRECCGSIYQTGPARSGQARADRTGHSRPWTFCGWW